MKKTKLLLAALMYGLNILSPCLAQYNVGNDDGFAFSSVGSTGNEVALSLTNLSVDLGNDTAFCQGNTLTLDAGNSGATYLWQDNSTIQTLAVTTSGTYFVQVTDSNSNTASDTIVVSAKTCTGINAQHQASGNQFQVFPNPNDGDFELEILNSKSGINNAELIIYNVLGEKVYQAKIQNLKSKIQNLKKGVYFLQLATEEGMWNEKIIVQ